MAENVFIHRILLKHLEAGMRPGRVVVLHGPRQVGKTTLLQKYLEGVKVPFAFYNGEDIETQRVFTSQSIARYQSLLAGTKILVIDEAQRIENIGLNLKIIVDHLPHIKVAASGSSSFDLARRVGEPLTGRKLTLTLFPLAQMELGESENPIETASRLEERLIYGSYPRVVLTPGFPEKQQVLKELVSSYLFRDILELDGVRSSRKISDLLVLLAFQVGKEVSLSELGSHLGMNKHTVSRYLDLLEQGYVLVNIRGFSRNLRKEVTRNSRYYFYDTGLRNALVNNFNRLDLRDDVGMLWENYLVIERMKKQAYTSLFSNNHFWRTYNQEELDWVEDRGGKLWGYEMKWGKGKPKPPKSWLLAYPGAEYRLVNRDNYLEFIA